jgi:hypothetical protein
MKFTFNPLSFAWIAGSVFVILFDSSHISWVRNFIAPLNFFKALHLYTSHRKKANPRRNAVERVLSAMKSSSRSMMVSNHPFLLAHFTLAV